MSRKRTTYSTEFKTKIVLEVLKNNEYNATNIPDNFSSKLSSSNSKITKFVKGNNQWVKNEKHTVLHLKPK